MYKKPGASKSNKIARKRPNGKSRSTPKPLVHGNVVYHFDELKRKGDFFIVSLGKRFNVYSSLRHYNKKHSKSITIKTSQTTEGLKVERT